MWKASRFASRRPSFFAPMAGGIAAIFAPKTGAKLELYAHSRTFAA